MVDSLLVLTVALGVADGVWSGGHQLAEPAWQLRSIAKLQRMGQENLDASKQDR